MLAPPHGWLVPFLRFVPIPALALALHLAVAVLLDPYLLLVYPAAGVDQPQPHRPQPPRRLVLPAPPHLRRKDLPPPPPHQDVLRHQLGQLPLVSRVVRSPPVLRRLGPLVQLAAVLPPLDGGRDLVGPVSVLVLGVDLVPALAALVAAGVPVLVLVLDLTVLVAVVEVGGAGRGRVRLHHRVGWIGHRSPVAVVVDRAVVRVVRVLGGSAVERVHRHS